METSSPAQNLRKRSVVPGEVLAVVEEFVPAEGVFTDELGRLKSRWLGEAFFDLKAKEVKVQPAKSIVAINPRDRVVAEVKDVQERIAIAEAFIKLPNIPLKYRRTGVILGRRNDSLENIIGIGDIALLNVVNIFRGMVTFDIYSPGCGVMLAMCSVCGSVLEKKENLLVCGKCGNRERRKTVLKYGNMELLKQLAGVEK